MSPDVPTSESHLAPAAAAAVPVRAGDRAAQRNTGSGNLTGDSAATDMAEAKPKTSPKAIKFLFGGLAG